MKQLLVIAASTLLLLPTIASSAQAGPWEDAGYTHLGTVLSLDKWVAANKCRDLARSRGYEGQYCTHRPSGEGRSWHCYAK